MLLQSKKHLVGYWVYEHRFPDGSVYVGISKAKSPRVRWHNGQGYEKCEEMVRKSRTYRWDEATHTVIKDGLTKIDAERMEGQLIAEYLKQGVELLNRQKRTIYNETRDEFYFCLKDAANVLNVCIGHICHVLKGDRKTAGGCVIRYATKEDFIKEDK